MGECADARIVESPLAPPRRPSEPLPAHGMVPRRRLGKVIHEEDTPIRREPRRPSLREARVPTGRPGRNLDGG